MLALFFSGFWLFCFHFVFAQASVTWQNPVNVSVSGNTITKSTPSGWDAGASSVEFIPSGYDGYVEFSTTNNAGMAGLSNGDSNADYPDIDYAIQPGPNYGLTVAVYEKGIYQTTSPIVSNPSDVFRVALESGVVKYYHNGTLIYTSSVSPAYPLLFDTALYANGGQIQNAVIASSPTPPEPQASSCKLTYANWDKCFSDLPLIGSPVNLQVIGTNCVGDQVAFDIYEEDALGLTDDKKPGQLFATFNQSNIAKAPWTINGSWDDDDAGTYKFYFEAAAWNERINSKTSSGVYMTVPLGSAGGCVNCTALLAPFTCECNDGYSVDRGFFASCDSLCAGHAGDAFIACGGGLPPGQPGEDKLIKWGIFNPLIGMSKTQNVFDLVVIIADWILNIAGSLIIILIIYSGVRFLISRGNPGEIQKAKSILFWALVGFGVVLIGKGFIYLVESVLQGKMPTFL